MHAWALQVVAMYDALGEEGVKILQCEEALRGIDKQLTVLQKTPVT